jgi:hypothetical protein
LLVDGRIQIQEAQNPDPEHWILMRIGFISIGDKLGERKKTRQTQTIMNKESAEIIS